jgi:hypothetical protein
MKHPLGRNTPLPAALVPLVVASGAVAMAAFALGSAACRPIGDPKSLHLGGASVKSREIGEVRWRDFGTRRRRLASDCLARLALENGGVGTSAVRRSQDRTVRCYLLFGL